MCRFIIFLLSFFGGINAFPYFVSSLTSQALEDFNVGNIESAVGNLTKASAINDVIAQFYLAQCYENGIGLKKDPTAAFRLYRKAAERGLPVAMLHLANCYKSGYGVDHNNLRANEWMARYNGKGKDDTLPDILEILKRLKKDSRDHASTSEPQSSPTVVNHSFEDENQNPFQEDTFEIMMENSSLSHHLSQISDVDVDIPISKNICDDIFALIIANENYQEVASVSGAVNDGEMVSKYCQLALGIPTSNIHFVKDATLNNIKREIRLIQKIANAYEGKVSFFIYYAGHGMPDEQNREAYLVPIDGFVSDISTCFSLSDFYNIVGNLPSKKTIIILDACFSGAARGETMLASARSVAIKPKSTIPSGNTIVIASAQGDETAYPYEEMHHGLFTYYLLKKIKETKGDVLLGDLFDYVRDNVVKKSLIVNGRQQTPSAVCSKSIGSQWINWKIN